MIEHDIEILQGSKFSIEFLVEQPAAGVTDPDPNNNAHWVARSLAGYKARMQIRTRPGGDVLLNLSSDTTDTTRTPGTTLTVEPSAATGVISVFIGATATDDLRKDGQYDIEIVPADADQAERIVQGKVTVSREITV